MPAHGIQPGCASEAIRVDRGQDRDAGHRLSAGPDLEDLVDHRLPRDDPTGVDLPTNLALTVWGDWA